MSVSVSIDSFSVTLDIPVQMRCRSSNFYVNNNGNKAQLLFNFDQQIVAVGYMETYDGGSNWHWVNQNHMAIRDTKSGLQYFEPGLNGWRFFEKEIQEDYAQHCLEKELK